MKKIPLIFTSIILLTGCTSKSYTSTSYEYKDYNITYVIDNHTTINGQISKAKPNDDVTFTINSENEYTLSCFTALNVRENKFINIGNGFTFKMPYSDVVVTASSTKYNDYKQDKDKRSILADTHYRNGLATWNQDNVHPKKEDDLTYDGKRETIGKGALGSKTAYWTYCQWWNSVDINSTKCEYKDGCYEWADETRRFSVQPDTGEVILDCNAANSFKSEYGQEVIKNGNWVHMLVEQHFPKSSYVKVADVENEGKHLYLQGDFRVDYDKLEYYDKKMVADTATFNWYLDIRDPSSGTMYYGFPIYDSRYLNGIPGYEAPDSGQPGSTGRYVYALPSRTYINEKFKLGKTYKIKIDVLPYIRSALASAQSKGYLKNAKWENCIIGYMSYGWEIYSGRVVNSTVSNIDLYIE